MPSIGTRCQPATGLSHPGELGGPDTRMIFLVEGRTSDGTPRKYPQELRDRAVRLARESERPLAHVARDLGVHPEALRNWVRQDEADRGERADQLCTVERDE